MPGNGDNDQYVQPVEEAVRRNVLKHASMRT